MQLGAERDQLKIGVKMLHFGASLDPTRYRILPSSQEASVRRHNVQELGGFDEIRILVGVLVSPVEMYHQVPDMSGKRFVILFLTVAQELVFPHIEAW